MKRELFDSIINIMSLRKGSNPKKDTVDGCFKFINGERVTNRYSRRLAKLVIECQKDLLGCKSDNQSVLALYVKQNKVSDDNVVHALWLCYSKGKSACEASKDAGVFSSRVYQLKKSVDSLVLKINEWEKCDGRNYNC